MRSQFPRLQQLMCCHPLLVAKTGGEPDALVVGSVGLRAIYPFAVALDEVLLLPDRQPLFDLLN